MSYKLLPNMMYRMPTHFGPSLGPRQGEDGRKFVSPESHKVKAWSVSFLTNREQLEELLPPGLEAGPEPVVTVEASYGTEIEWLAGRGYNTLGVTWPAVFHGEKDHAHGHFMAVLWENLADPILTGREELGFSKIYCELPEPRTYQGVTHCTASWMDFKFLDLFIKDLSQVDPDKSNDEPPIDGILHYKYMPRTQEWGEADVAQVTLTPGDFPNKVVKEKWRGEGKAVFHRATWEDMPTQFTIVNALHDLEIKEYREATMVKSVGGKDLSDQRILR